LANREVRQETEAAVKLLCDGAARMPDGNGDRFAPFSRHAVLNVLILRRFSAIQTSFHSALTRSRPRRLNCRNPNTFLIQPLGGSAIHFRFR